ncbi:MAG: carboxypeptidase-like regulatory domain-containing protein [Duncaniella sp.]|nr:carboxypeptidase-like regulatory domain-containing protein [Duncaniella sp.]
MKQKISEFITHVPSRILIMILVTVAFLQAHAREHSVSGVVKDEAGEAIPGATVNVKNNPKLVTVTDIDGKYSISVPVNATLVFSFIGYETVERNVGADVSTLDVTMKETSLLLEDVVVVGYGSMRRKDLTGAVSHVGEDVLKNRVATNALDYLSLIRL